MKNKNVILFLFVLLLIVPNVLVCSIAKNRMNLVEVTKFMRFFDVGDKKTLVCLLREKGVCEDFFTETKLLDCYDGRRVIDGDIMYSDIKRAILYYNEKRKNKKKKGKHLEALLPNIRGLERKVILIFLTIAGGGSKL